MKQTAVEWLVCELQKADWIPKDSVIMNYVIEQAKELEKEQIEDAFCDGSDDEYEHHINGDIRKNSEQYYNENYN